jgi:hypothetical protein
MECVKASYEKDWNTFRDGCLETLELADFTGDPELEIHKRLDVHPQTRIPHRLLTDPCDWDSLRLLFWLTRGAVRLQPEHSWDWEVSEPCKLGRHISLPLLINPVYS